MLRSLWFLLLGAWCTTAFAAARWAEAIEKIPLLVVAFMTLISTLAGLTSMLYRMDKEIRETGKPIQSPLLFCSASLLASWTASILAFLIAESLQTQVWTELAMILVFGFGGSRMLESAVDKYLSKSNFPKGAGDASTQ